MKSMGLNLEQLKMAFSLHRVQRFQTHYTIEPMSVAEHCYRVGMLYTYLGGTELLPAFAHDLEEAKTGDLPGPIKKELQGLEKFEALRPDFQDDKEKRLMKLADKLDLVIHIRPQIKFSDKLLEIYEQELDMAKDIAKELGKTREVNKLLKELKD
jgi:hypothetical protein